MRKILIISLIIFTSITLGACKNEQNKKIGILIYDQNDTFMQEYLNEIKSILDKKENIIYDIAFADRNQLNQNQQFINYYNQNYDLIIVNAVDRLSSGSMIKKAEIKGIPLIFINREPQALLTKSKNSYYVGSNSIQTGKLQASLVEMLIENNEISDINNDGLIQTIILKGEQGHQDAENRTSEVINELKALQIPYDILSIEVANWERNQAYIKMGQLIDVYDNIELIISNNDDMALGVIDYLKEFEIMENIKIIGVDGTTAGLDAINNGDLYGTIINNYLKQTKDIDILIDYLLFNIQIDDFDYDNRFQLTDGEIILKQS